MLCWELVFPAGTRLDNTSYLIFTTLFPSFPALWATKYQVPRVPRWQCVADYEEEGWRGYAGQGVGADMMGNPAGDDADHKIATVA